MKFLKNYFTFNRTSNTTNVHANKFLIQFPQHKEVLNTPDVKKFSNPFTPTYASSSLVQNKNNSKILLNSKKGFRRKSKSLEDNDPIHSLKSCRYNSTDNLLCGFIENARRSNFNLHFVDCTCESNFNSFKDKMCNKEIKSYYIETSDVLKSIINEVRSELVGKSDDINVLQNSICSLDKIESKLEINSNKSSREANIEEGNVSLKGTQLENENNQIFKLVRFAKQSSSLEAESKLFMSSECIAKEPSNSAFESNSTDYGGGGSDRYAYTSNRGPSRNVRDRDQDLRDPIEPLDHHHHYHYHIRHHRESSVKKGQFTRSLSNTETPGEEKTGLCIFILFLKKKKK